MSGNVAPILHRVLIIRDSLSFNSHLESVFRYYNLNLEHLIQLIWYCFQTSYLERKVGIYHGVAEIKLWVNPFVRVPKSLTSILT